MSVPVNELVNCRYRELSGIFLKMKSKSRFSSLPTVIPLISLRDAVWNLPEMQPTSSLPRPILFASSTIAESSRWRNRASALSINLYRGGLTPPIAIDKLDSIFICSFRKSRTWHPWMYRLRLCHQPYTLRQRSATIEEPQLG